MCVRQGPHEGDRSRFRKEGWEPLCRFLHVAVPAHKPFPHLNDTSAFRQMIQERMQTSEGA